MKNCCSFLRAFSLINFGFKKSNHTDATSHHHKESRASRRHGALNISCKQTAFSLVEMLMALLVASLLLAALAPVMTKKMNENIILANTPSIDDKDWKLYNYSSICTKASGENNVCEYTDFIVPEGVFSINLVMLSGGGGGAGATASKTIGPIVESKISQNLSAGWGDAETKEVPITKFMKNVKLTRLSGGGGGGGGGGVYVPDCPSGTEELKGNSTVKAFCMTRFNIGERVNLIQAHNYDYVPNIVGGTTYDNCADTASLCGGGAETCCWRATAANPWTSREHVSSFGDYSAVSRTLCQYNVTKSSCEAYTYGGKNWGLPTVSQLTYVRDSYKAANNNTWMLGWNHLQFCDMNSQEQAYNRSLYACPQGYNKTYGAPGAGTTDARCVHADGYNFFCLEEGYFSGPRTHNDYRNASMSGRCTIEKQKFSTSASGSGGSAGRTLVDIDLSEYVRKAEGDGKIILTAGKRGKGGTGATNKNTDASDGTYGGQSAIIVRKKNQNDTYSNIYSLLADGGPGGVRAFATSNNIAGGWRPSCEKCHYTIEGGGWVDRECSADCNAGTAGTTSNNATAQGGRGGNSTLTFSGGGAGALADSTNGIGTNGLTASYGAGGGGGTGIYSFNDSIIGGAGGNGAPGIAEISYYNEFPGAGGGGGAGGTLVRIVNLNVNPGDSCTIRVGGGGNGGSGTNGDDGGYTSISCGNSAKEYIVYGGKGGKLGTAQNQIDNLPEGGIGGETGGVNKDIQDLGDRAKIQYGEGYSESADKAIKDKINGAGSAGGMGGKSATGAQGGCGGMKDDSYCSNKDTNATVGEMVMPIYSAILNQNFGKMGAGGGGGGWDKENVTNQGRGSSGIPGYLFIYWDKPL